MLSVKHSHLHRAMGYGFTRMDGLGQVEGSGRAVCGHASSRHDGVLVSASVDATVAQQQLCMLYSRDRTLTGWANAEARRVNELLEGNGVLDSAAIV